MNSHQKVSKLLVRRGYDLNSYIDGFPTEKEIREFQEFADKHNFRGNEGWFLPENKFYPKVLRNLHAKDVILDVGAGNLALDFLMAKKCKKVYAVEVNPSVIADALKTIDYNLPRNLIVVCCNGLDFPIPKDVNTLVMLLRHFSQEMPDEWLEIPKIIAHVYHTWIMVGTKEESGVGDK